MSLNKSQVTQIQKFLENISIEIGPKDFYNSFRKILKRDNIESLASTIYSFGSMLTLSEEDGIETITNDLVNSYIDQAKDKLGDNEVERFKENLFRILSKGQNLKYAFKALNLQSEHERVFKELRIVTDIRFVFKDDILEKDRRALIIHQLRINYQKNDNSEDFFVNLDINDLKKIKSQVDRAIEKEKLLRSDIHQISFINISE